jgi:hypothetical protein
VSVVAARSRASVSDQIALWLRLRQDENLSRIDQVGIADLIAVGLVDHGVAYPVAVCRAADLPKVVAPDYDFRVDIRHHDSAGSTVCSGGFQW